MIFFQNLPKATCSGFEVWDKDREAKKPEIEVKVSWFLELNNFQLKFICIKPLF